MKDPSLEKGPASCDTGQGRRVPNDVQSGGTQKNASPLILSESEWKEYEGANCAVKNPGCPLEENDAWAQWAATHPDCAL